MNEIKKFEKDRLNRLKKSNEKSKIFKIANKFNSISSLSKYTYNFTWLGRPIIQFPQDMIMVQELIWEIKPDFVIETGIAHGGSLIFSASILELIGKGKVIGVDIEIRKHNMDAIKKHKMSKRIKMIQSSSIDKNTISLLKKTIKNN
ncbi:CmcI family methyltransferase, partial [Alphaproteobacteria bacterium]|nr:CmcI family methyltransferase [Alphaproteobacteria bacterium]